MILEHYSLEVSKTRERHNILRNKYFLSYEYLHSSKQIFQN